ncbi:hypothetical protein DL770_002897 [Monosporascus sp. CRB-9-2]|nr:hypothetical protein DL770_002897 [Monosporascus sp. CRB-9-2]
MGGTSKEKDGNQAGAHGEGLKVALLVLLPGRIRMAQTVTVKVQDQAKAECENSLLPVASAPNEDVQFLVGGNGKGRDGIGYPLDRSEEPRIDKPASITGKKLKSGYDFAKGATNRERQSMVGVDEDSRDEALKKTAVCESLVYKLHLMLRCRYPSTVKWLLTGTDTAAPLRQFALRNEQQPRWHRRRVMTQGGQRISEYIHVKRDLRAEVKRYATDDVSFVVLFEDIPVIYQPIPNSNSNSNTNTGVKTYSEQHRENRIESLDMLAPRNWFQDTNQTGSKAVIGIEKGCPRSDRSQKRPRTESIASPDGRALETMRSAQAPSPDRRKARGRRR